MADAKFIQDADVTAWLDELSGSRRIVAPVRDGDAVVFKDYAPGTKIVLDRDATTPPKDVVFPKSEVLMRYAYEKDPEDIGSVDLQLQETVEPEPTLVFGSRPCGARGFNIFDRVYDGEGYKDVYYMARRAATAFAVLTCTKSGPACFCHWVGSGPADTTGADLLVTPVDGGYVLEAVTPKGEELTTSPLLSDAGKKAKDAQKVKDEAFAKLGEVADLAAAPEKIMERFDDMGFWDDVAAKCISCGACTYLCPTCYCFNITDETGGMSGKRLRSWDNCMSFQFTLEGSGHNPRPTKSHRLKNRVGHKFSYYPSIHEGLIACCGCGRCIKSCPVSVDIREIVLKAMADAPAPVEESA
jgi:ferredoxin